MKEGYECDLSNGKQNRVEIGENGEIIVSCKFFRKDSMCVSPRIQKLDAPLRKCLVAEKALEDISKESNGQRMGRVISRIVNHK